MKLITKEIAKTLPALYANEEKEAKDVKVPLKLFNPCGPGTWYITEMDPETGTMFGFAEIGDPDCAELGYVSLQELESLRLPFGLKIERDLHWDPSTTLEEVMRKVRG